MTENGLLAVLFLIIAIVFEVAFPMQTEEYKAVGRCQYCSQWEVGLRSYKALACNTCRTKLGGHITTGGGQ